MDAACPGILWDARHQGSLLVFVMNRNAGRGTAPALQPHSWRHSAVRQLQCCCPFVVLMAPSHLHIHHPTPPPYPTAPSHLSTHRSPPALPPTQQNPPPLCPLLPMAHAAADSAVTTHPLRAPSLPTTQLLLQQEQLWLIIAPAINCRAARAARTRHTHVVGPWQEWGWSTTGMQEKVQGSRPQHLTDLFSPLLLLPEPSGVTAARAGKQS